MVNHNPAKFGGHRYCSGGYIIFSVVKGNDSTCSCLNLALLFIFEALATKPHDKPCSVLASDGKNINKSNTGKGCQIAPRRWNMRRKKKQEIGDDLSVCVLFTSCFRENIKITRMKYVLQ